LNKILEEQRKNKDELLNNTSNAFKIYNVNEYNVFKNKDE
jgi:hypothetical protein